MHVLISLFWVLISLNKHISIQILDWVLVGYFFVSHLSDTGYFEKPEVINAINLFALTFRCFQTGGFSSPYLFNFLVTPWVSYMCAGLSYRPLIYSGLCVTFLFGATALELCPIVPTLESTDISPIFEFFNYSINIANLFFAFYLKECSNLPSNVKDLLYAYLMAICCTLSLQGGGINSTYSLNLLGFSYIYARNPWRVKLSLFLFAVSYLYHLKFSDLHAENSSKFDVMNLVFLLVLPFVMFLHHSKQQSQKSTAVTFGSFPNSSLNSFLKPIRSGKETLEIIYPKRRIGEGSHGSVIQGYYQGVKVAVKVIKEQKRTREYDLYKTFISPYIVKFLGCIQETSKFYLIMELCEKDLYAHLRKNAESLSLEQAISYTSDIANGIYYLHSRHILHRDIKSKNVVLSNSTCKLCDFGTAIEVPDPSLTSLETSKSLRQIRGTLAYTAPELWCDVRTTQEASTYSDVYSFGIVLWEIFNTTVERKYSHPYPPEVGDAGSCLVFAHVVKGLRPSVPKNFPISVMNTYVKCVENIASKRPAIAKIVRKVEEKWLSDTAVSDWKYTQEKHTIQFEVSRGSYGSL